MLSTSSMAISAMLKWSPFDKFMYNLSDGTFAPFAADLSECNFQAPDGKPMSQTWLFPSE
eukprot:UN12908